jgi:hypothetical protein
MTFRAAGFAATLAILALPRLAAAQPSATQPVVEAAPAAERNWGIGVHLGGLGLHPEDDDSEEATTGMGGGGVQVRYRLHRRWDLELDLSGFGEHHHGDEPDADGLRRSTGMVVLGAMFHINPGSDWEWSVLAGLGGAHDTLEARDKTGELRTVAEFSNGLFRLGIGLEKRWERIGLAAQIYGVGMERNDDELDGPAYMDQDTPLARKQTGGLFQLAASYYF